MRPYCVVVILVQSVHMALPTPSEWEDDMLKWIANGMKPEPSVSNSVSSHAAAHASGHGILLEAPPRSWDLEYKLEPFAEFKSEMLQIIRITEGKFRGNTADCFELVRREHPTSRITSEVFDQLLAILVRPLFAKEWFYAFLMLNPRESAESLAERIVSRPLRGKSTYRDKLKTIHCLNVWRKYCGDLVPSPVTTLSDAEAIVALPTSGKKLFLKDLKSSILNLS